MRRHSSRRYGRKELAVLVGQRLRAFRRERGWTRSFLASKLEISVRWLERYEEGASLPPAYTLYQLAGIFRVSTSVFLDERPPESPLAEEDWLLKVYRFAATLPQSDQAALGVFLYGIVRGIGKMRGWLIEEPTSPGD